MLLLISFFIVSEELQTFTSKTFRVFEIENGHRIEWYWDWNDTKNFYVASTDIDTLQNGWQQCNVVLPLFIKYDDSSVIDKPYIIQGGNYFCLFDSSIDVSTARFSKIPGVDFLSNIENTIEVVETYSYEELIKEVSKPTDAVGAQLFLENFDIKNIKASSYLIEKTKSGLIEYKPEILNCLFIDGAHPTWIRHNPWVAGKVNNSSGIGEYLTIEFTEPKDNLVVLNGYVDLFKRYLYKANNRVKTAIITSLDENNPFEFEYIFEDYVHFAEINFPSAVDKVKFTIKEVYKGEKWDDTCITAVITKYENE